MLKAIAFDLWETLITNTPEVSVAQKRLRMTGMESVLVARGHAAEAARIESAYSSHWDRCHELYWSDDRDISCRRQIELFLELLGIEPGRLDGETLDELEHAYARAAVEELPKVVEGAPEIVAELKRRGVRTGLVSNTGRTPGYALREVLARLELAPLLDVMVFSNEHGECKPRPSIFEELRRSLDVSYGEILFVGDNLYVDVLGAKRRGMRAVHFIPPVRGTAVAPSVDHEPVTPDATVSNLRDLVSIIEGMRDEG